MANVTRVSNVSIDTRIFRNTSLSTGLGAGQIDGNQAVYQNSRTVSDTPTDYRARIPKGLSATTRLVGTRYMSTEGGSGEYSTMVDAYSGGRFSYTQHYRIFGNLWACPMPGDETGGGFNRANNMALMKAHKQVTEAYQGFQALVSGGELGEALRMIRSPARALREGVELCADTARERIRRRRRRPKDAQQIASDTWLEYVFGWAPLLSDVEAGVRTLANVMTYTPDRVLFRAVGRDKVVELSTSLQGEENWGPLNLIKGPHRTDYDCEVRYYGAVGMPPKDISGVASRFGVSWRDVVPAIWELIPYSFLIDYFTNVGDIIGACCTNQTCIKWMNRGWLKTSSRERVWLRDNTFVYNTATERTRGTRFSPGSKSVYQMRTITREAWPELSIPTLEFTIPGMGTKWINIAALVASRNSSRNFIQGNVPR